MVLMKYPKISASAKPKISIRCKPNIFVVFKNPKILTSRTGNGFLVSKTWFLWNTPRFRQVLNLEFWYNVGPKSLPFPKIPRFWREKVSHGFLASQKKHMVLMKYPKISTGAKLKISIRCKPNIFVLFKSPKILTSKSRPWVLASKTWFLWNSPRFWQVFYLKFQHNVGPKCLFFFKSHDFDKQNRPWVFGVKKHGSYEIIEDFDSC